MINLTVLIILFIQFWLALLVGYLLLLTVAASRAEKRTSLISGLPKKRFMILIPAHNEERLLPSLLKSLHDLDYPADLYEVHVVADNCRDRTIQVAHEWGVNVYERISLQEPGKGPALNWLLKQIWEKTKQADAIIYLDSDSIVSPEFLRIMAERLERGERVIQAYYAVRDPQRSWSGGLRYAALAVLHYLRPQGRMVLGGSVGLKGNGMVFVPELLEGNGWTASLTEDIEMHMALILDGERVTFAPDALVLGEMPDNLKNTQSQNLRWERGRIEMIRLFVPRLFRKAWHEARTRHFRRAYVLFDALLEHLIPPFAILFGLSVFMLILNLVLFALVNYVGVATGDFTSRILLEINLLVSLALMIGQAVYLVAGLLAIQAPRSTYLALVYTPVYVLWKFNQLVKIFIQRGQQEWVRTQRNEG